MGLKGVGTGVIEMGSGGGVHWWSGVAGEGGVGYGVRQRGGLVGLSLLVWGRRKGGRMYGSGMISASTGFNGAGGRHMMVAWVGVGGCCGGRAGRYSDVIPKKL